MGPRHGRELIEDAEIDNSVFDGITGITRAIHLCRGNAPRGRWLASGGYEAIAERFYPLLTNYDTLLLEYDTPRAGDFSSLKHVRPDTTVVLGLVTTKDGTLEAPAAVETRIREAANSFRWSGLPCRRNVASRPANMQTR